MATIENPPILELPTNFHPLFIAALRKQKRGDRVIAHFFSHCDAEIVGYLAACYVKQQQEVRNKVRKAQGSEREIRKIASRFRIRARELASQKMTFEREGNAVGVNQTSRELRHIDEVLRHVGGVTQELSQTKRLGLGGDLEALFGMKEYLQVCSLRKVFSSDIAAIVKAARIAEGHCQDWANHTTDCVNLGANLRDFERRNPELCRQIRHRLAELPRFLQAACLKAGRSTGA